MSVAETIKRGALKSVLLLSLLFVLAIHLIMLYLRLMAGAHDRNLAELEYRNGQLIIYQAGYNTGFVEFPTVLKRFEVEHDLGDRITSAWTLQLASEWAASGESVNSRECTKSDEQAAMSRIVYGVVPQCYAEVEPATPLKKNESYYLYNTYGTGERGHVFFKLVDCPEDPSKTCLETNSPYRKDRDEKRRSRRVR